MQVRKLFLLSFTLIMLLSSCETREEKLVKYMVTDAVSSYYLSYLDQSGQIVSEMINAESAHDQWEYSFFAEQGEIVYISGNYKDISSSLRIMIMVDGKIFRQGSSSGDTVKYVTVSGVIPY
ncbi:MAG: hypothetical protein EOM06_06920 [Sphingobacteriia bacterium]|nr:hypothetical protein [Sphingobacteriia bacterium]